MKAAYLPAIKQQLEGSVLFKLLKKQTDMPRTVSTILNRPPEQKPGIADGSAGAGPQPQNPSTSKK